MPWPGHARGVVDRRWRGSTQCFWHIANVGHLVRTDVDRAPVGLEINKPRADPSAAHGLVVKRPLGGHPGHHLIGVVRWHKYSLAAGEDYFRCHAPPPLSALAPQWTLFASAPLPRPRLRRFRRLTGFGRRSGRRASSLLTIPPSGSPSTPMNSRTERPVKRPSHTLPARGRWITRSGSELSQTALRPRGAVCRRTHA